MRVPALVLIIVAIYWLIPAPPAQAADEAFAGESEVLAFLLTHEETLQQIEKTWPDLGTNVATARAEFAASFWPAHDNIVEAMVANLGKAQAEQRVAAITQRSQTAVPADLSREKAVAFIKAVRSEAAGETEVDKVLVAYAYLDRPERELADGWRAPYSVKGHPKAGPLDVQIKVPASWTREEADQGMVVQKFFASTTPGGINFLVAVADVSEESAAVKLLPDDHVFAIKQSDMAEMIPEDATLTQATVTTLLDRPAGIMVYDRNRPKLGDRPFTRSRAIYTFRHKYMIMLTGVVFAADKVELEANWQRFEPLFAAIDRTLVDNAEP